MGVHGQEEIESSHLPKSQYIIPRLAHTLAQKAKVDIVVSIVIVPSDKQAKCNFALFTIFRGLKKYHVPLRSHL